MDHSGRIEHSTDGGNSISLSSSRGDDRLFGDDQGHVKDFYQIPIPASGGNGLSTHTQCIELGADDSTKDGMVSISFHSLLSPH